MLASFNDPFETLFALQRALDARTASGWMERGTAAIGSFPPINIFQKGDDFVAVVELPGIDKNDLEIEAKENTIRRCCVAAGYSDCSFSVREQSFT